MWASAEAVIRGGVHPYRSRIKNSNFRTEDLRPRNTVAGSPSGISHSNGSEELFSAVLPTYVYFKRKKMVCVAMATLHIQIIR